MARATAKKKSTSTRKPRRSAAQKAATAKMLAANRKRAGARKAPAKAAASKAPAKRRRYARAAAAPAVSKRRHYKRNPVSGKGGIVGQLLHDIAIPAGVGAVGALGVDAIWGNLKFIPVDKRTSKLKYLGKSAIGVGGALLLSRFVPKARKYANQIAVMTLGIQAHALASETINAKYPNAGLAGYDDDELNEVIENLNGLGEQLTLTGPGMDGLGFFEESYDSSRI